MSRLPLIPVLIGALLAVVIVGVTLGLMQPPAPAATPIPITAPWPERELASLATKCGQSAHTVAGWLLVAERHFAAAGRTGPDHELPALARAMDRSLSADPYARTTCKEFVAIWIAEADQR